MFNNANKNLTLSANLESLISVSKYTLFSQGFVSSFSDISLEGYRKILQGLVNDKKANEMAEKEKLRKAAEAAEQVRRQAETIERQAQEEARKRSVEEAKQKAELEKRKQEFERDYVVRNGVLIGYRRMWEIVNIPNYITAIGDYAFSKHEPDRSHLSKLTGWQREVAEREITLGLESHRNIRVVKGVSVPSSVKTIGKHAFSNCSSLTQVEIWNGVEIIDDSAFSSCNALQKITIPNSVKHIGNNAFGWCGNIRSVVIGGRVASIGGSTFIGCENLSWMTIGDNVQTIGNGAFAICKKLSSIQIKQSVKFVGKEAFSGWDKSQKIKIYATEKETKAWDKKWRKGCNATIEFGYRGFSDFDDLY